MSKTSSGNKIIKWISQNYIFRYVLFYIMLFLMFGAFVYFLKFSIYEIDVLDWLNKKLFVLSYNLNHIPVYKDWANHFQAYLFYYQNKLIIKEESILTWKYWKFLYLSWMETLPLFVATIPFYNVFIPLKNKYENYNEQIEKTSLAPVKEPIKELKKIILNDGFEENTKLKDKFKTIFLGRKLKDKQLPGLIDIYEKKLEKNITNYYRSLYKLRKKLNTKEKWNNFFDKVIEKKEQPYKYLKLENYKNIDYSILDKKELEEIKQAFNFNTHFIFVQELKKYLPRETFLYSEMREMSEKELIEYYKNALYFWLAKQATNYPLYRYVRNINAPVEFKKLYKWTESLNAPGVITVKPKDSEREKNVDLYFRLWQFRNYITIRNKHMLDYLNMINKDLLYMED